MTSNWKTMYKSLSELDAKDQNKYGIIITFFISLIVITALLFEDLTFFQIILNELTGSSSTNLDTDVAVFFVYGSIFLLMVPSIITVFILRFNYPLPEQAIIAKCVIPGIPFAIAAGLAFLMIKEDRSNFTTELLIMSTCLVGEIMSVYFLRPRKNSKINNGIQDSDRSL